MCVCVCVCVCVYVFVCVFVCVFYISTLQVVLKLGGKVTESVNECTHLVASRVSEDVCIREVEECGCSYATLVFYGNVLT